MIRIAPDAAVTSLVNVLVLRQQTVSTMLDGRAFLKSYRMKDQ